MHIFAGWGALAERISLLSQKRFLFRAEVIAFFTICVLIVVCVKEQIFTWWDDINFWSNDAKAMYFLNGFPGKYGNVSPEFGDYPPATSLFKWLFLQLSPASYVPGLQFAGYYVMNLVFMLPLLQSFSRIITKAIHSSVIRSFLMAFSCVLLILIPGICDGFSFYGTCADLTMGIVYGAVLFSIWDMSFYRQSTGVSLDSTEKRNNKTLNLYLIRIILFACILVLTKSVGIEWCLFALVFWLLCCKEKKDYLNIFKVAAAIIAVEGSWLLFCLINRRVAKLTSAGIKMIAPGRLSLPGDAGERISSFITAFFTYPLHTDTNVTFDLSAFAVLLILLVIPIVMHITGIIADKKLTKRLMLFTILTAVFSFGFIFAAHLTIFQTEMQYLDPASMAKSISRYGVPFTVGGLYLLITILFDHLQREKSIRINKAALAIIALFIILTTDHVGLYNAAYGYRESLEDNKEYNDNMIDEGGAKFIQTAIDAGETLWGHRVLYLRDDTVIHWVKDTYISLQVSPVAMVYSGIILENASSDDGDFTKMTADEIVQTILASHADFLYCEEVPGTPDETLGKLSADGSFKYDTIYSVTYSGYGVTLTKLKR